MFQKGYKKAEEEIERREVLRRNTVHRFWVKEHETKRVVFLDDEPTAFYEHNMNINGRWEQFTCLGKANGCPLCLSGHYPSFVGAFTIIDRTEWKDKKGIAHADEKRLFIAKAETLKLLKEKHDRWGGLKGFEVIVTRKSSQDAAVGSDFERAMNGDSVKRPDLSHVPDLGPLVYEDVLKPAAKEDLRQVMTMASASSSAGRSHAKSDSSGKGDTGSGESDIPF